MTPLIHSKNGLTVRKPIILGITFPYLQVKILNSISHTNKKESLENDFIFKAFSHFRQTRPLAYLCTPTSSEFAKSPSFFVRIAACYAEASL